MLRKKGSDPLFYYPQSNPSFAMKLSSNLGSPLHLLENYKLLSNEWMRSVSTAYGVMTDGSSAIQVN